MSTALDLDLDLATLVGELEDVPCESAGHDAHPDGPATDYCHVTCPGCDLDVIKAYCAAFIHHIRRNGMITCSVCWTRHSSGQAITILGPVNGRAS